MEKIILFALVFVLIACSAPPPVISTAPSTPTIQPTFTSTSTPPPTETSEPTSTAVPPVAKTEEEIAITSTLEKIGVDLDSVELKMVGEMVVCIDKATGKEVCRDGSFDLHFAQEAIAASGKLATRTYEPKILNGGYVVAPTDKFFYEYTNKMLTKFILGHKEKYGVDFSIYKNLSGIEMMLDSVNKYWGMLLCRQEDPEHEFRYLIYEMTDENGGVPILPQMGEIVKVPILPTTPEEVMSYWKK